MTHVIRASMLAPDRSRQPRRTARVDGKARACTSIAIATLLVLGLAGCAAELRGRAAEDTRDVGLFTGEYVDGKPLYRFPSILVIGSRSSVGDI